jgi:hypothetical protein
MNKAASLKSAIDAFSRISDIAAKAKARRDELTKDATVAAFDAEMKRFLPSARVAQMAQMRLQRAMLKDSADLLARTVVAENS